MSSRSRGGRRAAQPTPAWQPPERLLPDGMAVRFIEETGGQEKVFDFATVDAEPGLRQWLARVLARRVGPRSATKRIKTVETHFAILRLFAAGLPAAGTGRPVRTPADLTASHVTAFCDRHEGLKSHGSYIDQLRSLLRDDPEILDEVRTALVRARAPRTPASRAPKEPGYSDADWQLIMTALRGDVRLARDRIRAGGDLLGRFRAGQLADEMDVQVAGLLDVFDWTGEFPRWSDGGATGRVSRAGGVRGLASRLCLTLQEMTAFALLLTALTGENFGTVAAWPAVSYRPDGGSGEGPGIALLEAVKPRRGPEREHMVTSLEDLPAGLAEILSTPAEEDRLFRSPLRVYQLLVELTEVTRRHGGHTNAFSAYALTRGTRHWASTVGPHHVLRWARSHGFPNAESSAVGKPAVDVRRIRQTVIETRRRPIAHSRQTMNDRYLMPSAVVQHDSQEIIAAAMREEVAKARQRHTVPVLSASFVARAAEDAVNAAVEVGLKPEVLKRLLTGEQDTGLASCTDHLAGPHTEPGIPCPASFLDCLGCENARALPHLGLTRFDGQGRCEVVRLPARRCP